MNKILAIISALLLLSAIRGSGQCQFAYVPNDGNDTISVLDVTSQTIVASISVPGSGNGLRAVAVSSDGTRAYVAALNSANIYVINTSTNTVVGTLFPGGGMVTGVALSPDGTTLYVANNLNATAGALYAFDTNNLSSIPSVLSGLGTLSGLVVSPDGSTIYVNSPSAGDVLTIDASTLTQTNAQPVGANAAGIAITPDGSRVIIANRGGSSITVLNAVTNLIEITISANVGFNPTDVAISPDGTKAFISFINGVHVFDIMSSGLAFNQDILTVNNINVRGISMAHDGSIVVAANSGDNSVSIIDANALTVTQTVPGFNAPFGVGNMACYRLPTVSHPPSSDIPTLGEWGLIILSLFLLIIGVISVGAPVASREHSEV